LQRLWPGDPLGRRGLRGCDVDRRKVIVRQVALVGYRRSPPTKYGSDDSPTERRTQQLARLLGLRALDCLTPDRTAAVLPNAHASPQGHLRAEMDGGQKSCKPTMQPFSIACIDAIERISDTCSMIMSIIHHTLRFDGELVQT
jgi:hypothetical protein